MAPLLASKAPRPPRSKSGSGRWMVKWLTLALFVYTLSGTYFRGSSIDFEKPATELDTELDVEGTAKLSAEERAQKAQKAKEGKEAATARAGRKEDSTAAKATTRTPRRVPEVPTFKPAEMLEVAERDGEAAMHRTSHAPLVTQVVPPHGPRAGGGVVLIRGKYFGDAGALLHATIGGRPCEHTRWLSPEAVHCLVPKGMGKKLAVRVHHCSCSSDKEVQERRMLDAQNAAQVEAEEGHPVVRFSYDEDALGGIFLKSPALNLKIASIPLQPAVAGKGRRSSNVLSIPRTAYNSLRSSPDGKRGVHGQMHKAQLVGNYELAFYSAIAAQKMYYGVAPTFAASLPKLDMRAKHDRCAIVGHSGSMLGTGLGSHIDTYAAVFRMDNAPSAYKYAQDVGRRTTYQILNHEWTGVLLNTNQDNLPHVARWWLDVATLVLWSSSSELDYVRLRWLYPDAAIMMLSRDLESATRALMASIKDRMEEALNIRLGVDPLKLGKQSMSSLVYATMLAQQVCGKVDIYGVFPRCGKHTKGRCRYTYWDDSEPSNDERLMRNFEQKMLMAMHIAGHVNTNTPARAAPERGGSSNSTRGGRGLLSSSRKGHPSAVSREHTLATVVPMEHSVPQFHGACDSSQCVPSCHMRGRFVNGSCYCDTIYAGPNCERNLLRENTASIVEGLELLYNRTFTMNQKSVIFPHGMAKSGDGIIPLPEGTTHNRTAGDFYRVEQKLYQLLPANDSAMGTLRYHTHAQMLGSCAVVGNSGSLLYRQYGRAIDVHDVVYRFNQAPVDDFELHVGARSTHESLNSAWMKELIERGHRRGNRWNWRKQDTSLVIFEMFDPAGLKLRTRDQIQVKERWWKKSYMKLRSTHPDKNLVVLSPEFMAWATNLYGQLKTRFHKHGLGRYEGEKPMSGYYAILWALQVCKSVDVYGFTPYRDEDRFDPLATKYHYFDGAVPREHSHSFDLARYLYQLLSYQFPSFNIYD